MARDLGLDDVVDHFTLVGDELDQLRNKSGATRLGFAVLLKFLLWHRRFPRALHEVPDDAVAHLARQVHVPAAEFGSFDLASRTAKRHRTEIRAYTGFRECTVADAEALAGWLAEHVASGERRPERVPEELIRRCRAELIEPPTPERMSEIARSALHRAEQKLVALISGRLDAVVITRLEALIAVGDDEDENVLGLIKAAPGNVSLETMLAEISKLEAIRAIGLPADLFDGIDARIIAGWRARAAVESPVHLRDHPQPTKLALLCALLHLREREVTDALAQLLISTIHRIRRALRGEGDRRARQGLQARDRQGSWGTMERKVTLSRFGPRKRYARSAREMGCAPRGRIDRASPVASVLVWCDEGRSSCLMSDSTISGGGHGIRRFALAAAGRLPRETAVVVGRSLALRTKELRLVRPVAGPRSS